MVYAGKNTYRLGRMLMSHLAADTLSELHEMADKIGVNRKHFQDKAGKPHYDICREKKMLAIEFGAKEISDRKFPFFTTSNNL